MIYTIYRIIQNIGQYHYQYLLQDKKVLVPAKVVNNQVDRVISHKK